MAEEVEVLSAVAAPAGPEFDLRENLVVVADGIAHELYRILSHEPPTWTEDDRYVISLAVRALERRRDSVNNLILDLEATVTLSDRRERDGVALPLAGGAA